LAHGGADDLLIDLVIEYRTALGSYKTYLATSLNVLQRFIGGADELAVK
jgi:hypothetical protein